ncbi:MAG: hypothetical protein SF162_06160 [bacterium]|nr:hypothetical protein [bacterium]
MAFEFEALVGHLHLVNGRAISLPPPGALVEVTPKKAARGREIDTFFALVLPGGETMPKPEFFERMAGMACETYFGSTGSITSGLQSVFKYLNENLYLHNAEARRTGQKRFEASLICGVMRGAELYIGRVGGAVAAVRIGIENTPFPASFDDDDALLGAPLGVQVDPDTQIKRFEIQPGMRVVFADPLLADLSIDQVGTAMAGEDISVTLTNVKDLCLTHKITHLQAAAFEFVPAAQPVALPVREVVSTAELTAIPAAPPDTGTPPPAPEPAPAATPPEPARPDPKATALRRSAARKQALDRTIGGTAIAGAGFLQVLRRMFDLFVPQPRPGSKGWLATPAATGVTILIPVVVVAAVVVLWVTGTGESEYDRCIAQSNETADAARTIPSSDVTRTISAWNAVIISAEDCLTLRDNDPEMRALIREARAVIDALLSIERRDLLVLDTFPNASLSRVVLQGEDLYVLDDGNDQVYRVTLGSDGVSIARRQEAIPAMRRTASVLGYTVGDIVDITWSERSEGLSQSNALVMLDSRGILVDCTPRFLQDCSAQQLPGTEAWNAPQKMVFWGGALYILDAAANQLWRYRSTGSAFSTTPTEYFTGTGRPDIRTAIDFDIDEEGVVILATSDGRLLRFRGGELEDFAFSFREGQTMNSVDNMFRSTNPIAQSLYFISRRDRTIYETTFSGTFMQSYRAFDESLFTSLADVAVDVNRGILYAVSGNSLFAFRRSL